MARKRGQGEGSIYQRGDGLWVAATTTGGKRRVAYARTKKEATAKLQKLQQEAASGLPEARKDITVEVLAQEYLLHKKAEWRPKTAAYAALVFRAYIVPTLGSVKLSDLDARRVQLWMRSLQSRRIDPSGRKDAPLSPRSVQLARSYLCRALDLAMRYDWVPRNVARLTDAPKSASKRPPEASIEQSQAILRAVEGDALEALFVVLVYCGLRIGEALGLRWSDWSETTQRLTIERQLGRESGTEAGPFALTPPKSDSGVRSIPVPPAVASALKAHRERQEAGRAQWEALKKPDGTIRKRNGEAWGNLIFVSRDGNPLAYCNVRRSLKICMDRAGIVGVTPHTLRHHCASILIAEGLPLTVIARVLGHASPAITMSVYAHQLRGTDGAAADAMTRALDRPSSEALDKGKEAP